MKPILLSAVGRSVWYCVIGVTASLAGCRSDNDSPASAIASAPIAIDIDSEILQAQKSKKPIILLIFNSKVDPGIGMVFSQVPRGDSDEVVYLMLDISSSRNRAAAARFHPAVTPLLLCLSPRGMIITRDEKRVTSDLVSKKVQEVLGKSPAIDAKLELLENAVAKDVMNVSAQIQLADFEQNLHNDREAIPHLELVAHLDTADISLRICAWVNLVRAHLWVLEPEKGRHEANALLAAFPESHDAYAGGKLVLGIQDANAKRFELARRELQQAASAAPGSTYSNAAADAASKLPAMPR